MNDLPDRSPARFLTRAVAYLVVGIAPLVLVEVGLHLAGYEPPADPQLEGFADDGPIFVRQAGEWVVDPGKRGVWRAQPLSERPASGVLRVFSVGDSVTWGHRGNEFPDPLASYSEVLEELLRARDPGRPHRVVNCGARTFGSSRAAGVVDEILDLAPDVLVLYVGTSEHIDAVLRREYRRREERKAGWFEGLRIVAALTALLRPSAPGLTLPDLRARDPALRAAFVGPDLVLPDASARRNLIVDAERNLAAIVAAARRRQVPVVLATVPSNLRFPPFATLFEDEAALSAGEAAIRQIAQLLDAGRADEALDIAARETAAHPGAAGLHYRLAQVHDRRGDPVAARRSYLHARDADGCPQRALGAFNEAVRRLARDTPGVHLADIERLFERAVADAVPDDRLFLDNCHPRPPAHRLIAEELLRVLETAGLL